MQSTIAGFAVLLLPSSSHAVVTDETDAFADNWWSSKASSASSVSSVTPSDEITVRIKIQEIRDNKGLGLELGDVEFRTNRRVFVKSLRPASLAAQRGIQKNWIIVSLNGKSTERTDAQGVALMLSKAVKEAPGTDTVDLRFRDPSVFREKLTSLQEGESVTTQVAPAGDTTQRRADGSVKMGRQVTSQSDQQVTVTQLVAPKMCNRGAQVDDLLEISYLGMVVETGDIFDGSAVRINGQAVPGRGNDVSLYFVLGKQPFGQFPPSWDVGLEGMCVGERRRLVIPPVLAYGSKGVPKRGIPPDATLQYDITLVSINGLSTPQ